MCIIMYYFYKKDKTKFFNFLLNLINKHDNINSFKKIFRIKYSFESFDGLVFLISVI